MSAELDVPLTPSADQIRRREFVTVRRGYDPDQVRQYLDRIADEIEVLGDKLRSRQAEAPAVLEQAPPAEAAPAPAPAGTPVDPYNGLSGHMTQLLRSAEQTAGQILREAEAQRDQMLAEARADADRIHTDAQGRAEAVRQEAEVLNARARTEADRMLSGLDGQRTALVAELQAMRDHLLEMAQNLGSLAAEHEDGPRASDAAIVPADGYAELWGPESEVTADRAPEPATGSLFSPEELPAPAVDPLDLMFPDMPTLSLDDLDPGEFDR